ncbi:MAG: bi-domain-containing oxidoreductase [Bauldia sp.]|nr:bi-domain-containing oxidoreductase [Bauldia sp.]
MLVEFGRASLLQKARKQPERVRDVIQKARTDGLLTTIEAVQAKLADPIPLGYCNTGVVLEVGGEVRDLKPGDRVASNGTHSELVVVPANLCARIPGEVDDATAAFTVAASVSLQGIRLAAPTLGETVAVIGAGLLGLLAVQLLRAAGCQVLAVDLDPSRLALAKQFGAEICDLSDGTDPVGVGMALTGGVGVDAVLIAASTTSSDPVTQAAHLCRKRGRIVLVGVTGLELSRADFYAKELSFQVSSSYGPGRYDPLYEEAGQDYPVGFVRWTAKRNFEAILSTMAAGGLDLASLVTHRIPFSEAESAYDTLLEDREALGILLEYPRTQPDAERSISLRAPTNGPPRTGQTIGVIGAGQYASRVLVPTFKAAGARLEAIASRQGTSAGVLGRRFGFGVATTDTDRVIDDPSIDAIVVATRHDSHADLTARALSAGKNVFVEKPLATTLEGLAAVETAVAAMAAKAPLLMVGFNRRFSPLTIALKKQIDAVAEPKAFIVTVNAGAVAPDSWVQDADVGAGRIIGEACHFIDLLRHLSASPIVSSSARRMGDHPAVPVAEDKAILTLGFADGSLGVINYLANGSRAFPKERIEVFAGGRTWVLNNFRSLKVFGQRKGNVRLFRQDKGQQACVRAFVEATRNGTASPIPLLEILEVARVTIDLATQIRTQQ